jgi:hypothetical protein
MDELLKKSLLELLTKKENLYFYNIAICLTQNKFNSSWKPDYLLNQRIDFLFISSVSSDRVIKELKVKMKGKFGNDDKVVEYWAQFISCFVKLKPLTNGDNEFLRFKAGYHVWADVIKVYEPEKRLANLNAFNLRWGD